MLSIDESKSLSNELLPLGAMLLINMKTAKVIQELNTEGHVSESTVMKMMQQTIPDTPLVAVRESRELLRMLLEMAAPVLSELVIPEEAIMDVLKALKPMPVQSPKVNSFFILFQKRFSSKFVLNMK